MARPKKDESLHRGKRVYIRFTELEYELVAGYAKDAGYPIGTFVRKQALREKLEVNYNIVADLGEIQNLTVQAAGIGNNLNQIARYFHGGGLASRGMLEELKKCIAEIRELRQEIVQLGGVYRGKMCIRDRVISITATKVLKTHLKKIQVSKLARLL